MKHTFIITLLIVLCAACNLFQSDDASRDLDLNIRNLTEIKQSLTIVVSSRKDSVTVEIDAFDTINYIWENPNLRGSSEFLFSVGNLQYNCCYIDNGVVSGYPPFWLTISEDSLSFSDDDNF